MHDQLIYTTDDMLRMLDALTRTDGQGPCFGSMRLPQTTSRSS